MMEILPSRAFESFQGDQRGASCPGEIREESDLEEQAPAKGNEIVTCSLWNNLQVVTEAKLGQVSKWQIVYPEAQLKMAVAVESMDVQPQLSVRLRDDPNLSGMCTAAQGSALRLSNGFGDFGERATKHVQKEAKAAQKESRLRKQRQAKINQKLNVEVTQTVLKKQKWVMISFFLCLLIVLTAMILCTVTAYNLQLTELQGLGLAVGFLMLFGCTTFGNAGLWAATGSLPTDLRGSVQAARPELEGYEDQGVQVEDCRCGDWRCVTLWTCCGCALFVPLTCAVHMVGAFEEDGHGLLLAVLWGPAAFLVMCCGGVIVWREEDGGCYAKAACAFFAAFFFPFYWPVYFLGDRRLIELFRKPPKRLLDAAVHTTHDHTIVFEGNVLPKRETVCSWPGKYATAWNELVEGARQNDISAAVVFLPEGSEHFGLHDPIPANFAKQDLQDLHGECWCTPLYGEQKPWGCRWWSKWIANIEQAASQECTLVVYYFNSMRGKGKVKDFTTAGEEYMRREAIFRCKDAFLKSDIFQDALDAGLKHLSKEQGPDSSSPYSREVHRLFLAWLPEKEAQFMEASEGLGNSQKAEVAWLERNGYQYIEKEIWELESSSPKAIGELLE